jgi:hypothetical protein
MTQSDPSILQHWVECLRPRKIGSEILSSLPKPVKQRRKPVPPVYIANAPAPQFISVPLATTIRESARNIPLASTRLRWVQTVVLSHQIMERLYKSPDGTILFYDFLFQIEQHLQDIADSLHGRWSETAFTKRNSRLMELLEKMDSEIEAVGIQVQERL